MSYGKHNQQCNDDQIETLTEKSSGIKYIEARVEPRQGIESPNPGEVTPNDDGKK